MEKYLIGFFGVMAAFLLVASLLVFLLPETDKLPMPNNIADIESLHKKK